MIVQLVLLLLLTVLLWKLPLILNAVKDRIHLIREVDKFNGPLSFPLIGTAWQFSTDIKELTLQMRSWGLQYRDPVKKMIRFWIGTQALLIPTDPTSVQVILESQTLLKKSNNYDILIPWLGTGLLISSGQKWRQRRKLLTPSFHFNVLNDFQKVFDFQSKILTEVLSSKADGKEFDIFDYIKRCALDIICETAMGTTVEAQTHHDHPYVNAVRRMNQLAFKYQRVPWLWLKPLAYLSGFQAEFQKNLKIVTSFTQKVIEEKAEEFKRIGGVDRPGKKAFLDMLIEMQDQGGLTYEDIREEVDTFMFEGHDTTSAGIGWTLWCLAHHPECQEKVHQELDDVFGRGSDRECTVEDLKKLKYLEKCVKEALRLRPSVPNLGRMVEENFEIEGRIIPKGCTILVSPAFIHINPDVYENPEVFNPENFSEENNRSRHPYAYIPFSAGPRNCIGQKFAIQEEKTMLSWIFRKYRIPTKDMFLENVGLPEIIMNPSLGFPISLVKR